MDIYKKYGARVVNAHGTMLENKKIVPKDTVLMFLTHPGYCTGLQCARTVYHNFFEKRTNLEKFISGNVPPGYMCVSDIKNRTHGPGDQYDNMSLTFQNKKIPGLGYVRKLPLTTQQHIGETYYGKNRVPTFAETLGPIKRGTRTKLSEILKSVGPGVYVIASCRPLKSNRNIAPLNLPSTGYLSNVPREHPRNPELRKKNNTLMIEYPGIFNYQLGRNMKKTFRPRMNDVLAHISKTSGKNAIRTYIAPLPANTNTNLIRNTILSLRNKSKLPLKIRAMISLKPSKKAEIVYKHLYFNKMKCDEKRNKKC